MSCEWTGPILDTGPWPELFQRLQYPLNKEYTLNHIRDPTRI